MIRFAVRLTTMSQSRLVGKVEAHTPRQAEGLARKRWPFAPRGALSVEAIGASVPARPMRGFDIPAVQARAVERSQSDAAREKRRESKQAAREARLLREAAMTPGQKRWRDLAVRRLRGKRKAPVT